MARTLDEAEVRLEVRQWLAANWDPEITLRSWWRLLAGAGWAFPTWPEAWSGRGYDRGLTAVVRDELRRVGAIGAPRSIGQTLGAPVILTHGSEEQQRRFLPALATGEENWCQFFSEPGAGSDLASLQTRAVRDGDVWIVNGQKVWSSSARNADRGILLARTDIDQPKHRGISFFVIDIDQPGVELRPIRQINGEAEFNESFFTDAVVPDSHLIGGANNGWAIAVAALMHERTEYAAGGEHGAPMPLPGRIPGLLDLTVREVLERDTARKRGHFAFPIGSADAMVGLARARHRDADPGIRARIAGLHAMSEAARITAERAGQAASAGRAPGPEGSLGYMAGVRLARLSRDLALDILGPEGMLEGPEAPDGGRVQQMALSTLSHGIQGGTEQIQRNIVGERVLGLPKEPQVDRDVPFRDLRTATRRD